MLRRFVLLAISLSLLPSTLAAQGTRLLREPTLSQDHVAFTYGADIWVASRDGGLARRITATQAVESNPHFSPDGQWIAFTSNRAGVAAVYVVSVDGGDPMRLSWYPAGATARGWSPDGQEVLYATSRGTAPSGYNRLWTVARDGGPSTLLSTSWGNDGDFSADGRSIVIDRMSRWDPEWRSYRGGQNTPLVILNLSNLDETHLPNPDRSTDLHPVWQDGKVYFLSDRDWAMNVWSYDPGTEALEQITHFDE